MKVCKLLCKQPVLDLIKSEKNSSVLLFGVGILWLVELDGECKTQSLRTLRVLQSTGELT